VVESVASRAGGDEGGMRPDDVLLDWERKRDGEVVARGTFRRWEEVEEVGLV